MALSAGMRLGPYEIVAPLGVGGMGEVFRARDTALNRVVAIKILPDHLASDPDRLSRFSREAQTLAALNHPNIAQIYGFEQGALVMELVDGDDLAERLTHGPVPVDEALSIATQIAEGLAAAHSQGFVHRDLKPANIKVRADGMVKILDFGLAKALAPSDRTSSAGGAYQPPAELANSPTLTSPLGKTEIGVILGTAAYMSPEQARGKPVDKRADIWAFGCILFEMLTARRTFAGDDVTDTLAAIVRADPDWSALPAETPASVHRLLHRCLEKDVRRRLADIADARLDLEEGASSSGVAASELGPPRRSARWRLIVPAVAGAALVGGLIGVFMGRKLAPLPAAPISHFTVPIIRRQTFSPGRMLSIAPDGSRFVYAEPEGLYLRTLASPDARLLPGTESAHHPVFSPDGASIAFRSATELTIKTLWLNGGTPLTLAVETRGFGGLVWSSRGVIVSRIGKILLLSSSGSPPQELVSLQSGEAADNPQLLPDGRTLIYSLHKIDNRHPFKLVAKRLDGGEQRTILENAEDARYVPSGHLVYAIGGVLYAVPFDPDRLTISGTPVPVINGVRRANIGSNPAQYSVSETGTLIYVAGSASASDAFDFGILDRKGVTEPLKLPSGPYSTPRVSPDGSRIAFAADDGTNANIWICDLSGATSMRRLTFGGHNRFPVWSPDGQRVTFQSDREGDAGIWWQRADGIAERLTRASPGVSHTPQSWSPAGDRLLYTVTDSAGAVSLWAWSPLRKSSEAFGDVRSVTPIEAVFSPDGRWVAYGMAETLTSSSAIYVQPFPASGARYQISRDDDGHHPVWSANGRELAYIPGPGRISIVDVTTHPEFVFGTPRQLSAPGVQGPPTRVRNYDIFPTDGRFLILLPSGELQGLPPEIHVVLNWFEDLRQRVPTR